MLCWVAGTLMAGCTGAAEEPETPAVPERGEIAGPPVIAPGGLEMVPRRGSKMFNSKPDHPISRVVWRGHEGLEVYLEGEFIGTLPATKAIQIGDREFQVLVGPGDFKTFERRIIARPGILVVELGD